MNLTQEQLAQQLGVSNKTISKWENGWTMPDYGIVPALCQTLDITVAELIQGQEAEEKGAPLSEEQAMELVERISSLEKMVRRLRNALRLMGAVVLLRGLGSVGFGVVSIVMAYAGGVLAGDTLASVSVTHRLLTIPCRGGILRIRKGRCPATVSPLSCYKK